MLSSSALVVWSAVSLLLATTESLFTTMDPRIQEHFNRWNTLAQCWGQDNMFRYYMAQQNAVETCSRAKAVQMPEDVNLMEAAAALRSAQHILPTDHLVNLLVSSAAAAAVQQQANQPAAPMEDVPIGNVKTWNQANSLPVMIDRKAGGGQHHGHRAKRAGEESAAGPHLSSIEEANKRMLINDYSDFRWSMATKLGNLSCVMAQLQMLDDAGNINLDHYVTDNWSHVGQQGAAQDPVFVAKLKAGFRDCYAIAQAWPQPTLDRNPLHQKYGRHMIFFTCVAKTELQMCTKYQAKKWLEALYGHLDDSMFPEAASDPYEAAAMVMRLKYESASPEEEAVDRFFWGQPELD